MSKPTCDITLNCKQHSKALTADVQCTGMNRKRLALKLVTAACCAYNAAAKAQWTTAMLELCTGCMLRHPGQRCHKHAPVLAGTAGAVNLLAKLTDVCARGLKALAYTQSMTRVRELAVRCDVELT
jgi:hypothetical protein